MNAEEFVRESIREQQQKIENGCLFNHNRRCLDYQLHDGCPKKQKYQGCNAYEELIIEKIKIIEKTLK